MPAAKYRERVKWFSPQVQQLGGGDEKTIFLEEFSTYAEVIGQSGAEVNEQRRVTPENTWAINVRRSSDTLRITQEWQAQWCGRAINVSSAIPTPDRVEINIRGMEVKGAG